MSVAFLEQTLQSVPAVSIIPQDLPSGAESDVYKNVEFYNGSVHCINTKQLPLTNPYRTNNVWRWNAQAFIPTILQAGGQVTFKIDRGSGSGHTKDLRLRIQWTNSSSFRVSYVPLPLMIQLLQFTTPSGKIIQQFTGSDIWLACADNETDIGWNALADCIQASDAYGIGDVISPGESGFWYLTIPGNMLECSNFPTYLVDGDMLIYVTFFSNQFTNIFYNMGAGNFGDLTVQALSLDAGMVNQPQEELSGRMVSLSRGNPLTFVVPYIRTQQWVMTLNATSTYSLPLTGIKGDVVYAHVWIRGATLQGDEWLNSNQIASFQWQNAAGQGISGQQFIEDIYNRRVQYPKWSPGQLPADYDFINYIYTTVFAEPDHAIISLLNNGYKAGCWPFTTNENFVFNTPGAGVNEQVLVTVTNNPATSGSFYIEFDADGQGSTFSENLGYNATLYDIQTAIQAMNTFQGSVDVFDSTGSGNKNSKTFQPLTQTGNLASFYITYTGRYANKPMASRDFMFQVINNDVANATPVQLGMVTSVDIFGQYGITSGATYTINCYAWTTALVTLGTNGQLDVINS